MERSARVQWTNWTFGIWWGDIGRKFWIGVDIGPLQVAITRPRKGFVR